MYVKDVKVQNAAGKYCKRNPHLDHIFHKQGLMSYEEGEAEI